MGKLSNWVIIIVLVLAICFAFIVKQNRRKAILRQKINFDPASITTLGFYSRMDKTGNSKKLTVEQIKENATFANINEEDAKQIIEGLHKLSILTYNIHKYGTGKI